MTPSARAQGGKPPASPSLLPLLKPYRGQIFLLLALTIVANSMNLLAPRLIARSIDGFGKPGFALGLVLGQLAAVGSFSFIFTYGQSIVQTYASEKVARDLRTRLVEKLSVQTYGFVETVVRPNCSPISLPTSMASSSSSPRPSRRSFLPSSRSSARASFFCPSTGGSASVSSASFPSSASRLPSRSRRSANSSARARRRSTGSTASSTRASSALLSSVFSARKASSLKNSPPPTGRPFRSGSASCACSPV